MGMLSCGGWSWNCGRVAGELRESCYWGVKGGWEEGVVGEGEVGGEGGEGGLVELFEKERRKESRRMIE